ncbi:hypothetical protein H5P28_11645 [Ruficoccus amylovorans]|uniref:Uncharacterized protein n=1 Tax=Ruficoccus amylovorans TaxID=1804625 RepID=A0A842HI61_9BACT|nr:hypothetical protein [Ruficoccus amylovorans]MBC2594911.1 hypothetical protein [Ruficoccus amylovorans]
MKIRIINRGIDNRRLAAAYPLKQDPINGGFYMQAESPELAARVLQSRLNGCRISHFREGESGPRVVIEPSK